MNGHLFTDLFVAWFGLYLVRLTAVLAGTWVLVRVFMARSSAARRHFVLGTALLGALLVPLTTNLILPFDSLSISLPSPPQTSSRVESNADLQPKQSVASPAPAHVSGRKAKTKLSNPAPIAPALVAGPPPKNGTPPQPTTSSSSLFVWIPGLWLVGSLVVLGDLVLGWMRLRFLLAEGTLFSPREPLNPLQTPTTQPPSRLRRLLVRPTRILSCDVDTPMTCGFLRPSILLPRHAANWSPERLAAVLSHESAHLDRKDWMVMIGVRIACAAHWFHPLTWVLSSLFRREAEIATDDRVLESGTTSPADYALAIVTAVKEARDAGIRLRTAEIGIVGRPDLEKRIHSLLRPGSNRATSNLFTRVGSLLILGIVLSGSLCFRSPSSLGSPAPSLSGSLGPALQARWEADGQTVGLFLRGRAKLDSQGNGIAQITASGYFLLLSHDHHSGILRRFLVVPRGLDTVDSLYAENAVPQPMDQTDRAWLRTQLNHAHQLFDRHTTSDRGLSRADEFESGKVAAGRPSKRGSSSVLYGETGSTLNPVTRTFLARSSLSSLRGSETHSVGIFVGGSARKTPGVGEEATRSGGTWMVLIGELNSSPAKSSLRLVESPPDSASHMGRRWVFTETSDFHEPRTRHSREWVDTCLQQIAEQHAPAFPLDLRSE